jgi:RNA-directed DNA polymerase
MKYLQTKRKSKWYSLYDKIYEFKNIRRAWIQVKANQGAPGIDGVTIEQYEQNLEENLNSLRECLRKGIYTFKPVKRVDIPKDGSKKKKRTLGIATVEDRIVQQAIAQIVYPIFEDLFDRCYGYIENRGAHDAISEVLQRIKQGFQFATIADIKGFFDNIDREKMIELLTERIADGRFLRLIRSSLRVGTWFKGTVTDTGKGLVQGSPLSPVLANIYLVMLDRAMTIGDRIMIRYADDFLVLTRTKEGALRALKIAKKILNHLKLEVNEDKSGIKALTEGWNFLGFTIDIKGLRISDKAIKKFKRMIRGVTRRHFDIKVDLIIGKLSCIIRG